MVLISFSILSLHSDNKVGEEMISPPFVNARSREAIRSCVALLLLIFSPIALAHESRLYAENRDRAGVVVEIYSDGGGRYSTKVKKQGMPSVQLAKQVSFPPPRVNWISADILQVDYGSGLGADVRSIFYSIKRNRFDGPYDFVKVVDSDNELILCAADSVYIRKLYAYEVDRFSIVLSDISTADLKWFVVGDDSRFIGRKLLISYMNNHSDNGGEEEWVTQEIDIPPSLLKHKIGE